MSSLVEETARSGIFPPLPSLKTIGQLRSGSGAIEVTPKSCQVFYEYKQETSCMVQLLQRKNCFTKLYLLVQEF